MDDPHNEESNLEQAKDFVIQSAAFSAMQQQLWHSVFPTLDSKIIAYIEEHSGNSVWADRSQWLSEVQITATDLRSVNIHSVKSRNDIRQSSTNKLKYNVELLSGEKWDWWPLKPPIRRSSDTCA